MSSRALFLLPPVLLVSACSSIVNIEVDDSARFRDFETSILLPDPNNMRLRLRATQIDSDFTQSVNANERLNIDGASIVGPTEFVGEYDVTYWSIALGSDDTAGDLEAGDTRFAGYIGIGKTDFDLSMENSGQVFRVSDDEPELYVQYRVVYAINSRLNFGFSGAAGLSGDFDGSREYELSLEYELLRQLVVTAGYRWFDYFYFADDSDSDIELDLSGPFIGFKLPL